MPSGKQLSFAFGEVSPALRFRVDASFYSQALSKLENAYVRKAGGVSNRAGTKYFITPTNQIRLADKNSRPGIRIFPFTVKVFGVETHFLIEMKDVVTAGSVASTFTIISENGGTTTPVQTLPSGSIAFDSPTELDLSTAAITQLGNSAIITVANTGSPRRYYMFNMVYDDTGAGFVFGLILAKPVANHAVIAGSSIGTAYGLDPKDIPVSYYITQTLTDGSEVFWEQLDFSTLHPHSQLSLTFTYDGSAYPDVQYYNIYRADAPKGNFALVGRAPPSTSGATFRDYLVSADLTSQPPQDDYLYPDLTAISSNVRKVAYYKQRAILAYVGFRESGSPLDKYIEGQIGASKLGCARMFGRPLTPNNVDAFSFTVPVEKLSKVNQLLVMNRLIVFTDKNTFAIRGGPSGVLTPQEVNPENIYEEGAAEDISPVVLGSLGFFIPPDKSKLMNIQYNRDDSVSVSDISALSDHLFEAKDIRHMVGIAGTENNIWMLKKDGTMVCLTISLEGSIQGFSTHKTDGYIEDFCVQYRSKALYPQEVREAPLPDREKQYLPTLVLSVIRNGARYYEALHVRDDVETKNYLFADSAVAFGAVPYTPDNSFILTGPFGINITTSTNFLAGSPLTLTSTFLDNFIFTSDDVGSVYDFFFDVLDTDGNVIGQSKRRIIIDSYIAFSTGHSTPDKLIGHCLEDIPAVLQNVMGQSIPTAERDRRLANFTKATKVVTGLTHLAGKAVSVYADGTVLSSPNNPTQDTLTVANDGTLDLGDYYDWGYVGLPYETNIETLNLEAGDNRTLTDAGKLINKVGLGVRRTIGGFVGQTGVKDLLQMEQIAARSDLSIENPTEAYDGYLTVDFPSEWEQTGRVLIKQVDPLPMSILSVYPKGVIGE